MPALFVMSALLMFSAGDANNKGALHFDHTVPYVHVDCSKVTCAPATPIAHEVIK